MGWGLGFGVQGLGLRVTPRLQLTPCSLQTLRPHVGNVYTLIDPGLCEP